MEDTMPVVVEPGQRPAPWTFPPPPPTPPSRNRRVVHFAAWAAGSALVVAATAVVLGGSGSAYPSEWDERVRELAEFASDARGLTYEHPVHVDFLSEDEYSELATYAEADLTVEDKVAQHDFEASSRALGLVRGDVDLFESSNELVSDGTLAYYDLVTKRVMVRGTDLTPSVRATLVHELTHVLQDQNFDLNRVFETDAQNNAFRAVAEGDANRIEQEYLAGLSDEEYAEWEEEVNAGWEQAQEDLADVPDWLTVSFGAAYDLGEPLVHAIEAAGGRRAVDEALSEPPLTEEQLVDATRFLAGEKPKRVTAPKLPKGARLIDEADFGTLTWMFMLSERMPAAAALDAVDGWGGDAYIAYEVDDQVCAAGRFAGDTVADTTEMATALDRWAGAMPAGAEAEVTRAQDGKTVGFVTCDPGPDAEDSRSGGGSVAALDLLATRAYLLITFLDGGAPRGTAACAAGGMVREFTPEEIASQEEFPGLYERMAEIQDRCATPVES